MNSANRHQAIDTANQGMWASQEWLKGSGGGEVTTEVLMRAFQATRQGVCESDSVYSSVAKYLNSCGYRQGTYTGPGNGRVWTGKALRAQVASFAK